MKFLYFLSALALLQTTMLAQSINFSKAFPAIPIEQLENIFDAHRDGASIIADFDGDGDDDIIITGLSNSSQMFTHLYRNDGSGNFIKASTVPFPPVFFAAIDAADVDGDSDIDLLVTGTEQGVSKTRLMLNNGAGIFSLSQSNANFAQLNSGSVTFGDVDGDSDPDVILTGQLQLGGFGYRTQLYTNNGSGVFSLVPNTPFTISRFSDGEFADVDGDNDLDFMLCGEGPVGATELAELYLNNGSGVFTLQSNSVFTKVQEPAITFFDFDGNQTKDILITGEDANNMTTARLYANAGNGAFSLVDSTSFTGVRRGQVAVGDVNGDGFPDLYIGGRPQSGGNISTFYANNGDSTFTELTQNVIDGVQWGDAFLNDLDGDNDLDFFLAGEESGQRHQSILFVNDSTGTFYETGGSYFQGLHGGTINIGDIDGDNDNDIFFTGYDTFRNKIAKMLLNDGTGSFTPSSDTVFKPTNSSASAFADVDGDGDLDLFVTGLDQSLGFAELYINDSIGTYTLSNSSTFQGVFLSAVAFADIDGDGDQDLLTSGSYFSGQRVTTLYTNNGAGVFSTVGSAPFTDLNYGTINFADVDNDGDQDVFLTGQSGVSSYEALLYINDSTGNFTLATGQPFSGVRGAGVQFTDVDNDSDLDLVVSGQTLTGFEANIYLNNGMGSFNNDLSNSLTALVFGSLLADDLEGDGDIDLILFGSDSTDMRLALVYENDSTGSFNLNTSVNLRGMIVGQSALGDLNGDQSPDLISMGLNNSGQAATYLYYNKPCFPSVGIDSVIACDRYTWIDGSTYFSSVSGITDTLVSSVGCDSVVFLNLIINSSDSLVDVIDACDAYTWLDGITYTSSNATALVSLVNATGCDSTIYLNLTINSADTSVIRNGGSLVAQAGNATFQWLDCNAGFSSISGETAATFTPTSNGNYAVQVFQNGCTDTSACFLVTDVGVENGAITRSLHIFPNPSGGEITIAFQRKITEITIDIYDSRGLFVRSLHFEDRDHLPVTLPAANGMYLLRITANGMSSMHKIHRMTE